MNPAKLYMGDGGSYFLGYSLAIFSLMNSQNTIIDRNFIPYLIILSLPILDMSYVMLMRYINRKSLFLPDKNHIHHRISKLGYNEKNTVNIIYLLVISSIIVSIIIT